MFWHSECESRGLGRLPCCTLTVMSPQAGSLRVSFIILSMLGYCKVQLPQPAVNQQPPVPRLEQGMRASRDGAVPQRCRDGRAPRGACRGTGKSESPPQTKPVPQR